MRGRGTRGWEERLDSSLKQACCHRVNARGTSGPALVSRASILPDGHPAFRTHSSPMASSSKPTTARVDEDVDDLDGTGSDPSPTLIVLISDNRRSRAILVSPSQARCSC